MSIAIVNKIKEHDIPCTIVAKYAYVYSETYASICANKYDFNDFWNYEVEEYEEILIGEYSLASTTLQSTILKYEFNINNLKTKKKLQEYNTEDFIHYFKMEKDGIGKQYYHIVKVYCILQRIPRAPNCIISLFNYTVDELQNDIIMRMGGPKKNEVLDHKSLTLLILKWYANFNYNRICLKSKIGNIKLLDKDNNEDLEIEYNLYSNLIDEIQGY